MFVRTKKIKGKEYAYLVRNKWTSKGSRQKVDKYLGRIKKGQRTTENSYIIDEKKKFGAIIQELIKHELSNHNITDKEIKVIAMNEGFLCKETIQDLLNLKHGKERPDKEGERLAIALLESGLKVKETEFEKLFETWKNQ